MNLVIGNSYSRIEGLTATQLKELRVLCSYKTDDYHGSGFGGVKHLCSKRGEFPSGLYHIVYPWLRKQPQWASTTSHRRVPKASPGLFTLSLPVTPYPLQEDAIYACRGRSRGMISAVTGSGKSIMIAMLINQLQVRTLVIVPTLGLKKQLTESFRQYFGASAKNLTIENIDSNKLNNLKDFDCLILDEAHHAAAKTYRKLNKTAWSGIFYRFCFSATAFRSKDEEQILMESITSKVLHEITYQQAVEAKMVVPIEAYYIDLPKKPTNAYTWAEVYSELIVKNVSRNKAIQELLLALHASGKSTLCLVKEIAHGNALSANGAFLFANGKDEDTDAMIEEFSAGRLKTLVGTEGVTGEGRDTRAAEYAIIAGLGKSKPAFMQKVGRLLRNFEGKESGKVILIRDPSHKFTLKHFQAQCKILRDMYGVKPIKLEWNV